MALAFDTLRAATQLHEAGFEEPQAHALVTFAESVTEHLATKDDLGQVATTLDTKIDRVNTDLTARIDHLEAKMDAEFGRVHAEFGNVRSEMAVLKRDIIIWLGGLAITMTGLAIAATSVLG